MARYRGKYVHKGHTFRSKFELKLALQLEEEGVIYGYEGEQYEYFTKVQGGVCNDCSGTSINQRHWYTPDFILPGGIIIEAKGHFTASNRVTLKAVREAHDTIDLRLVFMVNNKITRNSVTTCADWCLQHGFLYAIGKIPKEWLCG